MRVLLKQILLNPDNPRVKKDADYKRLKTSLAQFPQMLKVRGLGIVDNGDGTYTVLGGNQRRSALSDLERVFGTPDFDKYGADADAAQTLEDYFKNGVPCQDCTNFTEEQRRRFIVTDNLSYAEWDTDAVRAGWSAEEIGAWGSDQLLEAWREKEVAEAYSRKIESPIYEPTGECPSVEDLADFEKYNSLLSEIEAANLPEEVSVFLQFAATRHIVFNYRAIAEYYCHAPAEIQRQMENSALVIVDFKKAIERGFVKLTQEIAQNFDHDYEGV